MSNAEVPDADALEQAEEVVPEEPDEGEEPAHTGGPGGGLPVEAPVEDVLEQREEVPLDDEDRR